MLRCVEWNEICSQHISELGIFLTNYRFEGKFLIMNRVDFRSPDAKTVY